MTGVLTQLVLDISGSIELSILAKATAILVLALAAVWISPRVSASVRSLVLACAFGILLMLPVAVVLMPPVALNVRATRMAPETSGPSAAIAALGDDSPVVTPIDASGEFRHESLAPFGAAAVDGGMDHRNSAVPGSSDRDAGANPSPAS